MAKTPRQAKGFVSLLVVSVLSVVIALVALGFSVLMNREVRASLDRELSAQAYYSSVAGLNDARAYLGAGGQGFTDCNDWGSLGSHYFVDDISGGAGAAKYSCITINENPKELIYNLEPGSSVTFYVSLPSMADMYFGWERSNYTAAPQPLGPTGSLPKEGNPALGANVTGLLRVGLYPAPNGTTTNAQLTSLQRAYFLYPNSGSGTPAAAVDARSTATNGKTIAGNCKAGAANPVGNPEASSRYCNAIVGNLQGWQKGYYVHLSAEYTPLVVTIQATTNGGGNCGGKPCPLNIPNAQAVVDVTGQGTDVLQRIRSRIDLGNGYLTPDYGVQSMEAICKGYRMYLSDQGVYGGSILDPGFPPFSDNACTSSQPDSGGPVSNARGELTPH